MCHYIKQSSYASRFLFWVFIYACDFQTTCNYTWLSKKDSYEFLGEQNSHQLVAPISAILEGIKSTCSPVFVFVLFFLFQSSQKNWHSCFFVKMKFYNSVFELCWKLQDKCGLLFDNMPPWLYNWVIGLFSQTTGTLPPPPKKNKNPSIRNDQGVLQKGEINTFFFSAI